MNREEKTLIIILRVIGISGLFAISAIFLPFFWMNAIHGYLGLGQLPDAPIVRYLARSLSAFYAILSTIILYISLDIRHYRSFLRLWAILVIVMGFVLLGIDLTAGMPSGWTWSEGPPTVLVGMVVLLLQRKIETDSPKNLHQENDA